MLFINPPQHTHSIKHYVNLQVYFKYGELVGVLRLNVSCWAIRSCHSALFAD